MTLLLIVGLGHVKAHENELWSHGKFVMAGKAGQKHCGGGYTLSAQADGSFQPYLLAIHVDQNMEPMWHKTDFTIEAFDCDLMFDMLIMCASPDNDEEKEMCNVD
jgi:hypothetical protein